MMILKLHSTLRIYRGRILPFIIGILVSIFQIFVPDQGFCKIYIDISSPSIQKINIAIPDFRDFSDQKEHTEFVKEMPNVISNDLELSGYFTSMDKKAFLDNDGPLLSSENIQFQNWSAIGTELLLKGGFTCIGRSVEVEVRLYDIFWGRQILGKKFLGKVDGYRPLMHRIGNEIIRTLTGHNGIFLSRLAFVGANEGHKEIYISDIDGHNLKKVTSDKSIALLPKWSPDGKSLLYNSYKEGSVKLYLKDLYTGRVRMISGRKGLNTGGIFVPNSKKMLLTLSYQGNPDIYSIDFNGKITKRYTDHWGIDISPSLSPDGKNMAFVSNRSGAPQIYIMNLSKGNEERLTFEGKYNTSPCWSSMDRIAFSQIIDGAVDIFTINTDGTRLIRLTEKQGNNEDPCWSPDGRYIVFSSNRTGKYHLYIMNANGQNQKRITFMKGEQTSPCWSPH